MVSPYSLSQDNRVMPPISIESPYFDSHLRKTRWGTVYPHEGPITSKSV
jgi:hypothetical protein